MAHVMKMTRWAVGHMFKHYERAKDEKGEYYPWSWTQRKICTNYQLKKP
mgnify:CR=1 FL=1